MEAINKEGIPCFSGSCSEMYLEDAFAESLRPPQRLKVARELGENSLMFMVHPTLSSSDLEDVCNAITKVVSEATA